MIRPKPSGFGLSPTGAAPDFRRRFMIGDRMAVDEGRR
jgi:hypothetical protein